MSVHVVTDSGTPSSSPIEAESSPDWHLTGLLTHALQQLNSLPEATLSGLSICSMFSSQRLQLRGSGGIAPRFPNIRYNDSTFVRVYDVNRSLQQALRDRNPRIAHMPCGPRGPKFCH